jgi:hypothetical protein
VRDEVEAFATCGDFEQGFLVVECRRCGDSLRVPLACKIRGICPSCMGRRMCETAALLVDHRLPTVPWRQVLRRRGFDGLGQAAAAGAEWNGMG